MKELDDRLRRLSPPARALLARRLGAEGTSRAVLLAHVEPRGGRTLDEATLLRWLADRLPEHMVPARVVLQDVLPRTPTGKVDRRALPEPAPAAGARESAPAGALDETEAILAKIWADVLGVEGVDPSDDFFELGGDSILSIRIIARAKDAGLAITPKQFFATPNVAALAASCTRPARSAGVEDAVEGPVPLTPIQHWFFDHVPIDPHQWNQAVWIALPDGADPAHVEAAMGAIVTHHDALRLELHRGAAGWEQRNAPPGPRPALEVLDLTAADAAERARALAGAEDRLNREMTLAPAPLLRTLLVRLAGESDRLLVVAHHLVVDAVSWQILVEDLARAHAQIVAKKPIRLPAKTTAFKAWAERLVALAGSDAVAEEMRVWSAPHPALEVRLPVERAGPEVNTRGAAAIAAATLTEAETEALLGEVPNAYRTRVADALLTALLEAIEAWTGERSLLVDLEGHGRQSALDDADLSRTVGWLTTVHPVPLTLPAATGPGERLLGIKEQLRRIPNDGEGHGLLRYLSPEKAVRDALAARPRPEVCVNYLGRRAPADPAGFTRLGGVRASARSPRAPRPYLLEIDAVVASGVFRVEVTYGTRVHARATIEQLVAETMASLRTLIDHCTSGVEGATPSDFPLAGLDQEALDRVAGQLDALDDEPDGRS